MTTTRPRSPSPSAPAAKKLKIDEDARVDQVAKEDINLPSGSTVEEWMDKYNKSTPYKHVVVPGLLNDALVRGSYLFLHGGTGMIAVTDDSSKVLSRNRELTVTGARRDLCLDGDGNKKKRTSTRCDHLRSACGD
jgi:hypothetical protein